MSDGENIFEDVAKLKKDVSNILYLISIPSFRLPTTYHDCRLHCIEMSGNEQGDLFLNMNNFFHKKITIQVKYCPICGFEGNEPPEFKLAIPK